MADDQNVGWSRFRNTFADKRVRRFWGVGGVALLLHGIVDPFVTYLAVKVYGVGIEINPWLASALGQGLDTLALVHLPLFIVVFGLFVIYTWLFARASETQAKQIYRISLVGWALIITWGLLVVGHNLVVLLTGIT